VPADRPRHLRLGIVERDGGVRIVYCGRHELTLNIDARSGVGSRPSIRPLRRNDFATRMVASCIRRRRFWFKRRGRDFEATGLPRQKKTWESTRRLVVSPLIIGVGYRAGTNGASSGGCRDGRTSRPKRPHGVDGAPFISRTPSKRTEQRYRFALPVSRGNRATATEIACAPQSRSRRRRARELSGRGAVHRFKTLTSGRIGHNAAGGTTLRRHQNVIRSRPCFAQRVC